MYTNIQDYNGAQSGEYKEICELLYSTINGTVSGTTSKVWHSHPVWFINGNPVVGYAKLKDSVQLLFWSGQSFDENGLTPEGTFKAAEARYTAISQIDTSLLKRWLKQAETVQWDYKNIVKNRGKLTRL